MLTITRKENEAFYIYPENLPPDMTVAELFAGGHIEVRLTKISRSQVKVAIDAPLELSIVRDNVKGTS